MGRRPDFRKIRKRLVPHKEPAGSRRRGGALKPCPPPPRLCRRSWVLQGGSDRFGGWGGSERATALWDVKPPAAFRWAGHRSHNRASAACPFRPRSDAEAPGARCPWRSSRDQAARSSPDALLSDRTEGRRKGCAPLAGRSTLNRLEHAPAGGRPDRYRRIDHDPAKLQDMPADLFIESWQGLPPERLVLDIDTTDDPVHGRQEGGFFHGCYGHYCLLPLYILCAGRPLFAQLRPGGADPAGRRPGRWAA